MLMARSENIEIKREVAAAFCSLSPLTTTRLRWLIAQSTIITLSLAGDDEVEKLAISTVANLVEIVELHDKLIEKWSRTFDRSDDVQRPEHKGEACRAVEILQPTEMSSSPS